MLDIVKHYDELAVAQYDILKRTLTQITSEELDWKINPEANSIRWILGHHLWFEQWVHDTILNTGRYLSDKEPLSFDFDTVEAFTTQFEASMLKRQILYQSLSQTDIEREFEYLGSFIYTVSKLIRTHAGHFTGHTWQIRFIRGTYSRNFKTDKTIFDPY